MTQGRAEHPPFRVEQLGERVEGIAAGIDSAHLRKLKRGTIEIDREIDLHGMTRQAARAELEAALPAAQAEGARCALVVHGRGLRSEGGPVLKESLPAWLTRPPLAALVMAFATARPDEGGTGATRVLLRRLR